MNVSINQIQAFCAVARTSSFAQAAVLLHVTQPAISIAIKNLEAYLGGDLLIRSTRSITLTPEGEAFYPIAQRLLADWEQSLQDVKNHFQLLRGKLEIAAMPTYATNILPSVLAKYNAKYPDINLTVHDIIAESVIDMVRTNRCELGITFEPADAPDLRFTPLYEDKFVAILPPGHPLLSEHKLHWSALLDYPHISLQKPAGTRAMIDKALAAQGMHIHPTFESHQLVSIGRFVRENLGLSVIPSTSSSQMKEMGLKLRPISSPTIKHKVGIVTKLHQPISSAASAMQSLLLALHDC